MRFGILAASVCALMTIGVSAQSAPTCADLKLVPAPRECKAVKSVAIGSGGLRVVSGSSREDQFAAKDLEDALKDGGVASGRAGGVVVRLERVSGERAKEISETPDEAYQIEPVGAHELVVRTERSILSCGAGFKRFYRGFRCDSAFWLRLIVR